MWPLAGRREEGRCDREKEGHRVQGGAPLERLQGESGPWRSEGEEERGVSKGLNRDALSRGRHEKDGRPGEGGPS